MFMNGYQKELCTYVNAYVHTPVGSIVGGKVEKNNQLFQNLGISSMYLHTYCTHVGMFLLVPNTSVCMHVHT